MSTQLPEGRYKIVSELSGKVLSVNGGIANDGTEVVQWPYEDKPHQQWQLTKVAEEEGRAFYTIEYPGSGMVMEAPGPWQRGVPVVMRHYEHSGDQRHREWKFESVHGKPDTYEIVNRRRPFSDPDEGPFVIDVQDADPDTKNIKMYPSWPLIDDRQHWKLRLY